MNKTVFFFYLAGVELEESLLPKMVLYCGGPAGGAADKHFTQDHNITSGSNKLAFKRSSAASILKCEFKKKNSQRLQRVDLKHVSHQRTKALQIP